MSKEFEYSYEREIYTISRIVGREVLIDILSGMSPHEIDRITQIASNNDTDVLTKGEATFYIKKFLNRVSEISGVYEEISPDTIQSEIARKRRFSSGELASASLKGFAMLSEKSPEQIIKIIKDESIYVRAIIISNIDYVKSEKVLSLYELEEQIALIGQIEQCEGAELKSLESLSDSLIEKMKSSGREVNSGGIDSVAQIVERMSEPALMKLLDKLDQDNPELAQKIRDNIMTFEDLLQLQESVLDIIFDNVDPKRTALAIRDLDETKKDVVLNALTNQKKEIVKAEIDMIKNAPVANVNDAKKAIIAVAKDLESKGKISLSNEE